MFTDVLDVHGVGASQMLYVYSGGWTLSTASNPDVGFSPG